MLSLRTIYETWLSQEAPTPHGSPHHPRYGRLQFVACSLQYVACMHQWWPKINSLPFQLGWPPLVPFLFSLSGSEQAGKSWISGVTVWGSTAFVGMYQISGQSLNIRLSGRILIDIWVDSRILVMLGQTLVNIGLRRPSWLFFGNFGKLRLLNLVQRCNR